MTSVNTSEQPARDQPAADQPAAEQPGGLRSLFPEKRVFVKSDAGTRFVRLGPRHQILALLGGGLLVGWCLIATTVLVISLVGSGTVREQILREQALYEGRLNNMARERDAQRLAALDAQDRYAEALDTLSAVQDDLFAAKLSLHEDAAASAALRDILARTLAERDSLRAQLALLSEDDPAPGPGDTIAAAPGPGDTIAAAPGDKSQPAAPGPGAPELPVYRRLAEAEAALAYLTEALDRTATERDTRAADAALAEAQVSELEHDARLTRDRNERIFSQLEEAVTLAMKPLGKMFRDVGLPPEDILRQMRRQYSGQGGPLSPISFSTKGIPPSPESLRAAAILGRMDDLNLYRMAYDRVPFSLPVAAHVRQTSGFGYRRDPLRGGTRLHAGMDWAGDYGTPIHASADGVVTHAGWQSGYGRLVKIQHAFGIETRFAHLSRITVKPGQRVSRGDTIGAMGNSGRSTGTHLHYEVRANGTPVNPLKYIGAARDVF